MDKIIFTDENNNKIELYVIEETTLNEIHYLLATEEEKGDSTAYILKEVSDNDNDITFEFVSDEKEIESLTKIFFELLDDVDFI